MCLFGCLCVYAPPLPLPWTVNQFRGSCGEHFLEDRYHCMCHIFENIWVGDLHGASTSQIAQITSWTANHSLKEIYITHAKPYKCYILFNRRRKIKILFFFKVKYHKKHKSNTFVGYICLFVTKELLPSKNKYIFFLFFQKYYKQILALQL